MKRALRAAVAIAAAVIMAACSASEPGSPIAASGGLTAQSAAASHAAAYSGGDITSAETSIAAASHTVSSATSSHTAPPGTSRPAETGSAPVKPPNLDSQVLHLTDLPAGWSVAHDTSSSAASGTSGSSPFDSCKPPPGGTAGAASAQAQFNRGAHDSLNESLTWYASVSRATAVFTAAAKALNGCTPTPPPTTAGPSGMPTPDVTFGAMSFPHVGDQSGAWQFSASYGPISAAGDMVAFRKGREIALVEEADLGSPDTDIQAFERLVKIAASKVSAR